MGHYSDAQDCSPSVGIMKYHSLHDVNIFLKGQECSTKRSGSKLFSFRTSLPGVSQVLYARCWKSGDHSLQMKLFSAKGYLITRCPLLMKQYFLSSVNGLAVMASYSALLRGNLLKNVKVSNGVRHYPLATEFLNHSPGKGNFPVRSLTPPCLVKTSSRLQNLQMLSYFHGIGTAT